MVAQLVHNPWLGPWLGMGAEMVVLTLLLLALRWCQRRVALTPEASRKLFHIGGGLTTLSFPWLFQVWWPPLALLPLTVGTLLALKYLGGLRGGLGLVLYGIERESLGEVYMPLSITLVWLLSGGRPALYCAPVLVLTLADPAAALVGTRFGRLRYPVAGGTKSLEGSVAFGITAYLAVQAPLLLLTALHPAVVMLSALLVAALAMLAEAVAGRGLDNLIIPLLCFGLLRLCLAQPGAALGVQMALALAVTIAVLAWRCHVAVGRGVVPRASAGA